HGVTSVLLQSCEFELPAVSNQTFLTLSNLMSLMVQNSTYPSEMAGRWVQGVAADTDPLTVRQLAATNLSSL
ncbi:hypothetical protein, partial [Leisingera sp. MMG026]|uniref:hypothetical protein n=1 Tax=Leisingera sp. MMG026 TaxID=2909982 RepID=UPI001F1BF059